MEDEEDDVELELLNEQERLQADHDLDDVPPQHESNAKKPISAKDKRSMVLLCVLCKGAYTPLFRRSHSLSPQTSFKEFL